MKKYLASLWESLIDGIVDINSHRSRSILQVVGVVLGVASVVSTFGLIEGGKRQMTRMYDETGGVRKMRIDDKQTTEATQSAQQKASIGLTYDDALALRKGTHHIEIVEPTMQRQAMVKAPSQLPVHWISLMPLISGAGDATTNCGRPIPSIPTASP